MKHSYKIWLLLPSLAVLAWLSSFLIPGPLSTKSPSIKAISNSSLPDMAVSSIQQGLAMREYHVSYDAEKQVYQSPNRQHNLRAYYEPGTLTVRNRKDSVGHNFKFKIVNKGIFADGERIQIEPESPRFVLDANTAEIRYDAVVEQYVNSEAGIRQNFIIGKPAEGSEQLKVQLAVEGAAVTDLGSNELELSPQGAAGNTLTYKDLKCWDADGNELAARMSSQNELITILVDVKGATFPVMIDPIIANGNPANAILVPEVNQTQAWLGGSVSTAGDVNGDGYSDVIVAASKYDNGEVDEGAAWVYYGSASGLNLGNAVMLQGNQTGARFGCFVSTAGDINKDGFSDIMVGALMYDKGETNEGAVFVYHGSATGITTNATLVLEGNQAEAYFGNAMGLAGDVNGDGYSDVVIGSNSYDSGQVNEGVAFVYHGSAQGLTANNPVKIEGNQAESMFGFTATGAGDVNGDGYSDIMVGARLFDKGQVDEGAVFIYHGSALGINPGVPSLILESNQASAGYGHAMGTAGDVNGDGYSDIVIGANMYDKGQTNEGVAFIHHGSAQGIGQVAALVLESNQVEARLGGSAGSAGDVNGDGYADVIISAGFYDNGHYNEGAAFVYHGAKTGLGANPASTLESNKVNAQFGSSVASAGDINGDGYSDVIIGAVTYDHGHDDEGAAFIWTGGAGGMDLMTSSDVEVAQTNSQMGYSVSAAGDVNNDGYDDIMVGAAMYDNGQTDEGAVFIYYGTKERITNSYAVMLESNKVNAGFGKSMASCGDINADGFGDVIIGSMYYTNNELYEGAAIIYYGSETGINKNNFTVLESNQANALMGRSVSGAGDINGDGFGDVVVGAEGYDDGQFNEGAVFVYHGSATGISTQFSAKLASDQETAYMGYAVAGGGDMNGDGFDDVVAGLPWYSNGDLREGVVHVYYGSLSGVSQESRTIIEMNKPDGTFGWSLAIAGDLNSDGFKDIIVGAPSYSNQYFDEGAAFTFNGYSEGIKTIPNSAIYGDQKSARLGESVAYAGDVDSDGYSDVIVGAPFNKRLVVLAGVPQSLITGKAFLYRGSVIGLNVIAHSTFEAGDEGTKMGASVSHAGDVNGDGYSDVIIGAPGFNNGAAFVCYGNSGYCERNNLRLYNTNLTTPINQTQFTQNNFGAGLYSKSFLGGNKGKLVWETKAAGQGFSKGANNVITNSTQSSGSQNVYASLGLAGTELKNVISKQGNATKVRVRVKYDPALALTGQTYGPWRYLSSSLGGGGVSPAPDDAASPMAETIRRKVATSESVVLYPNPARDRFSIDLKEGGNASLVRVLTSDGKLVLQTDTQHDVDVSKLAPGKYIVLVRKVDGSQSSHSILISR